MMRSIFVCQSKNCYRAGFYSILTLIILAFGCTSGCGNSKQSLYEEIDHELPEYWPTDMADAANKINQREQAILSGTASDQEHKELLELISWCPEVAGDTDITESQWQPIYEVSESLRKRISSEGFQLQDLQRDLDELKRLLNAAHQNLTPRLF